VKIKFIVPICFFLTSILLFNSSFAAEIGIISPEQTVTVYAGQNNFLEILVKNNLGVTDTFYITAWCGEYSSWFSFPRYWSTLKNGEITNITVIIDPPKDATEGIMTCSLITTWTSSNVTESKTIYLDIVRPTNVYISDLQINKQTFKPGETLEIKPIITSIDNKNTNNVYVNTKILKDEKIVQKFEDTVSIQPLSTETLSHNLDIEIMNPPGDYLVDVILSNYLNKVLDEKTITFNILPIHKLDQVKKTDNHFLYSDVEIAITNNGNTEENNFYVTESLPLMSKNFFYPEMEPVSKEEKENRVVYSWLIHELSPTESITIRYQLRFYNVVLISCILVIAVIWIVWLFFRPTLKKSYIGLLARDSEITMTIYLKNKGRKTLKDITVVDFVPPIAAVVKRFDTLEPNIRRKTTGTELAWKIKQLKPKEERILTYRIKPVIEIIGDLKLPKAYITYSTKIGKQRRVLSKTITVTGKVK
jgi:hypothetical protein